MTKTRIAGLLAGLLLLLGATVACANPPTSGTIASKWFRPEHYNDWVSFVCISYSSQTHACTAQLPIYHHDRVAPRWQFNLTADAGDTKHDKSGWIDVDQPTYDTHNVGDHYPDAR